MIEVFVPVLVVCLNGNCEFMQAHAYYSTDKECRLVLEDQRAHMLELATRAKTGKPVVEGTCVTARVKIPGLDA